MPKSNQAAASTTLEILVIRVSGQWLAVRSARQLRLVSFEQGQLNSDGLDLNSPAGQLGILHRFNTSFPVYDLAFLLGLSVQPGPPESGQLVQTAQNGQTVGFTIEEAQEIQRIPVTELRRLPEIISRALPSKAIWAVWIRSDGELVPLLDLSFVLPSNSDAALS